jgi:hypothetical protein
MVNVHVDPSFDEAERRHKIYSGDVVVYTQVPEVAEFAAFTRDLIIDALGADPIRVHERLSRDELADVLIDFKPAFIHHPESIEHVRRITTALGCRADELHADVPKLRTAFPAGGLSTGIAYAFQAHRDTWYAAPPQQINWWLPVWPAAENNAMEFYPRGFGNVVENNSGDYNYYEANAWRGRIKDFSGGKDTRVHPAPASDLSPDEQRLCIVPPVGGVMLFSGDQLHATTPNSSSVTRYSIDFRTVHAPDVATGVGAPRVDVRCHGTALRDFRRLSDNAVFTDEDAAPYDDDGAHAAGVSVYSPN